ncbi:ABC transporter substrate-binding protein [Shewanella sedimentimangrovi]|uniref:ABC transporter substrate-binding protein n=1 Tax=Shewanella sedimentimangrovi TaxID=2814293 RepID=A0ABX7R4N1_9GAMM|nr:ABC transporter substrate-binding protein [Shewanella sedimentimangrovi]QSX38792.1 ABC transporter substrate-binding protein [Shewanella sedimentimangrovi]
MKKTLIPGCLLILATIAVLWWNRPITGHQVQTVRIAISTTPLSAPLILASHLGLFDAQDLRVELLPVRGGNKTFDMMINDDVDMATSSESVVMFNAFNRDDFSVLASFATSNNDVKLISLKQPGQTSVPDLVGKRVGVVSGSASEFFLYSFSILSGESSPGVVIGYEAIEELAPALLAGDVDAVSIWEPHAFQLLDSLGDRGFHFPARGYYNLSFNLLAKRDTAISPQIQARVLRALEQAIQYINDNPELSRKTVGEYLQLSDDELKHTWPDYVFSLTLDNTLIANMLIQAHWATQSGYTSILQVPDFRRFVDSRALSALDQPHTPGDGL